MLGLRGGGELETLCCLGFGSLSGVVEVKSRSDSYCSEFRMKWKMGSYHLCGWTCGSARQL